MSEALNTIHWIMKDFCQANKLKLETEYRILPNRKFRWDYALPELKLAIEFQGGIYMGKSGHSNIKGQARDQEKMNLAQLAGWRILQYNAINYASIENDLKQLL